MDVEAEVKGLEETQRRMEEAAAALQGPPFAMGMARATLRVERSAKQKAPVDTGRLRASIWPEVQQTADGWEGVVGSIVKYAPFQELGTRPHFVSAAHIGRWAERHGLGYRGVFVSGKAHPFLQPAFDENLSAIIADIGAVVGDITTRANE
jgi:HK97 gp10 family phage protein